MTDQEFKMIACTSRTLFALDMKGRVWRYVPRRREEENRKDPDTENKSPKGYAFWSRLTDHRGT